jgi:hypothetical protein
MPINLLIIGHVDDPEFAGVGDWLGGLNDVTVEQVRRLADYWRTCSADAPGDGAPDLILVLERHPDEHAAGDIRRLIEQHPLARVVCGYGPWSESAARTRGAWPSATWVPAALLRECILSELSVIHGQRPPLAITADRADVFEQRYGETPGQRTDLASLRVAIDVPDAEYRSLIEDELLLQLAELVDTSEPWDLLLFDAHPEAWRMRELQRLLTAHPRAAGRIIILHELPDAAAGDAWSSEKLGTALEVRVVSKLAPLASLS